jgi:hypothetical protein
MEKSGLWLLDVIMIWMKGTKLHRAPRCIGLISCFDLERLANSRTAWGHVQSLAIHRGQRKNGFNRIFFQLTQLKSGHSRGLEGVSNATTRDSQKAGNF